MPLKVLIIDDEPAILRVLGDCLGRLGHEIRTAGSAEEGLAQARAGAFDAVLMDVSLPGMTGLRAVQEFASRTKAAIFLMTGHADSELEKDALLLGARALLPKPLDLDALKAALAALKGTP